jgi:hypothetical protein
MAGARRIGDDRPGPVAEASTREQCIALYPGSNPGRASSPSRLRRFGWACQPRRRRLAAPKLEEFRREERRWAPRAQLALKCRLMGPLKPFRDCGIWSKDQPRAREPLTQAHDPPKCRRFGVKIMCSFLNRERDRTQNRQPLLLIALLAQGTRGCAPFFCADFYP